MTDQIKTDPSELSQYLETGWQLIPLHRYDRTDEYKGKLRDRGKSPIHGNWTKRPYNSNDQVAYMEEGYNVGVRLRAEDLVIDVDPRNFPEGEDLTTDNSFKRLCEDCGIDPSEHPTVITGSGGLHVYMKKPADISVRDSLPDYEGVEFKTLGRQVVSAGSIHPTSKTTYNWDFLGPDLLEVKKASNRLLNIIRRPNLAMATGGGEHTQEELANMLEALDPEDFTDHDAWLTLMQACHHATAGDGRQEFVDWSTGDPEYADHSGIIGRRWDSLHADNDTGNRVTYRTLHKLLRDIDREDVIPRTMAEDDFETVGPEDIPEDAVEEHEKKGPLERMNDKFWAAMESGQFRIYWEEDDPETVVYKNQNGSQIEAVPARRRWICSQVKDFNQMLSNRKVQQGDKAVPIAKAWLEWGGRRSAKGVLFDPERDHEGFLNLWTGWGVEPSKGAGTWERLNELLFEVLCDGKEDVHKYVLDWSAYMIQHPATLPEVAICFQGGKGVGKGTWGRTLASLAGRHGMQINSSAQLTGRFNDHLRNVILLFADEALKPYDKDGESRLKGLITEPRIAYEGKGKAVTTGRNMIHVIMASNEEWVVPTGAGAERRFMVQEANAKRQGQHNWFAKLHHELDSGGYKALMWDLMQRDIGNWTPRENVPGTSSLTKQKLMGLTPPQQWWFNALSTGHPPAEPIPNYGTDWNDFGVRMFYKDFRDSYDNHCRNSRIKGGSMGRAVDMLFARELATMIPNLNTKQKATTPEDRFDLNSYCDGRSRAVEIPSLDECREAFEKLLDTQIIW